MPKLAYSAKLRQEYEKLFATCKVTSNQAFVTKQAKNIIKHKAIYQSLSQKSGVPWFFIGLIQALEDSSFSFKGHLHNGDPLTAKTKRVPKNRPPFPPSNGKVYTWEESAMDALRLKNLIGQKDWSLGIMLYRLEGFNGYGYRNLKKPINSPYLWSFSNHYTKGKYVADGDYDPKAVSKQVGCAVLLKELQNLGAITPAHEDKVVFQYDPNNKSENILELQKLLNKFGLGLKEDGVGGPKTSDAVKKAFGYYLKNDPRTASGARNLLKDKPKFI